jgi:hypothetical protein
VNERYFPRVATWQLPKQALRDSLAEMARDGAQGNEGIALWLGTRESGVARVTHLVALRGPGIIKRPDQIIVHPTLLNEVTDVAITLHVSLIGQIHSHGQGYGTDLSRTDEAYGIATPYFLSLVAPDYALRPHTRLEDCGVHVFEPGQGYRRVLRSEIAERVRLVSHDVAPMITVPKDAP